MEKVKREKLLYKIFSLVLATVLWFYLSYQGDMAITKTIRNVPISISGKQALNENGFSVYSIDESVNVSASGSRSSLRRINSKTLSASVNVSSIKKSGTYTLPATVTPYTNTNATFYVKGKDIKVVIEPIETKKFDIETDILSPTDTSIILKDAVLYKNIVTVSAPKSVMKQLGSVKTEQFVPEKDEKEFTAKLIAYGKNGEVLQEGVELNPKEISISYSFYSVKTVPIVLVTTTGSRISLPAENTVRIYGSGDALEGIDHIETEAINLALFKVGDTPKVNLIVPDGVNLADNVSELVVTITEDFYEE